MGSVGNKIRTRDLNTQSNTKSAMPWTTGYTLYKSQIESATEVWYNPETNQVVFLANEAPITPIFSNYMNVSGSNAQILKFLQTLWKNKHVQINKF